MRTKISSLAWHGLHGDLHLFGHTQGSEEVLCVVDEVLASVALVGVHHLDNSPTPRALAKVLPHK